jgi:2,4-dienoyl-CoA reductase-like NADH-dependent reductase (Old Yellow Enzyme family)
MPVVCKTNLRDGFSGGLELDESIAAAQMLEAAGADALVLSGGFTSKSAFYLFRGRVPLKEMVEVEHSALMKVSLRLFGPFIMRCDPFQELYFLEQAKRVRAAVKRLKLGLIGGVVSRAGVETAMREGFDFVVIGRALIADADFVDRLRKGEIVRSRCDACNRCVAEMDRPGGVRCVCAEEASRG